MKKAGMDAAHILGPRAKTFNEQAFNDFVFVSMCLAIVDWESVEKVLSCARQFCYISLSVGSMEHSLVKEIWPLVTDQPLKTEHLEMAYLLHLLYLKGGSGAKISSHTV